MAANYVVANPLPGGQAGVLMMRVGNTSLLAQSMNQFYKRDGSLNLTGPMDANNQAMNRVGNFQSNGSVSAAGDVGVGGNVSGNGVYGNYLRSNGDVSAGNSVSAIGVYGNYVQSNGNASVSGNAYINGTTVTGAVSASGSVNAGGSVAANGYLYAAGAVVPSTGGGQQVWEGWGCGDPQGAIRSDPNGKILSCQNGVWRSASGQSDGTIVSTWEITPVWSSSWSWGLCISRAGGSGWDGVYGQVCPAGTYSYLTRTQYNSVGGGGG
jgi:hypothetical protein